MTQKIDRTSIRFHKWLNAIGFHGVANAPQHNDMERIRAFSYESFDPALVKQTLGRAKKHRPGLFVFVGSSARKGVRVDSERRRILIANGKLAVRALLRTV